MLTVFFNQEEVLGGAYEFGGHSMSVRAVSSGPGILTRVWREHILSKIFSIGRSLSFYEKC